MDVSQHMKVDPKYPDDPYYNGPDRWYADDHGHAFIWDDMWLTPPEINLMMERILSLPEAAARGVKWQQMCVSWDEQIEHYVMRVPLYDEPQSTK